MYFALGLVAGDALGLTPVVFLVAGLFFVVTMMTYVEGSSLHIERGGASSLARYAFDELWSFIAGWAILLDYVIVMAIGAFAVPHYLAAFWGGANNGGVELLIAGAVLAYVAWANYRGIDSRRFRMLARLTIVSTLLFVAIVVIGLIQLFDVALITDTVELGTDPEWDDLVFAAVIAAVALTGIEAASGLAGDLRVGRRGLKRFVTVATIGVLLVFLGMSAVALMAVPVENGATELGGQLKEAPVLGVVGEFDPAWLAEGLSYVVGAIGSIVLVQAVNGQLLGIGRLTYSLGRNRQVPSLLSRLDKQYGTPYVVIALTSVLAFALTLPADLEFLAGLFAFGAMLAFTLAHVSIIVLRFREPDATAAFRVPLSVPVGRGSIPIPSALGALFGAAAWISVLVLHDGARIAGGAWMLLGIVLYVVYRRQQDKPLRKRFTIPEEALREPGDEAEYGSILVPVFGDPLDDDIVGTAGRLAAEDAEEGEGGAVLEALYVFKIPMSLPIDARVPEERIAEGKRALARAKEVGEEYEDVEVATAMVRGRTYGSAIVSEAKRRGVEAIVLAAEAPSRIRGGAKLGGIRASDRSSDQLARYVIEKATCKVILTAPPEEAAPAADEEPAGDPS